MIKSYCSSCGVEMEVSTYNYEDLCSDCAKELFEINSTEYYNECIVLDFNSINMEEDNDNY